VGWGNVLTRLDPRFHQALISYSKLTIVNGRPLKDVLLTMFSGGTPDTQNPSYWKGAIPWISPKDFGEYELDAATDNITEEAIKESSTRIAPANSVVLVVRSGVLVHTIPIGVAVTGLAINQDVKAMICRSDILPHYLAAYFRVFQKYLLPVITKYGATVQSINTAELKNLVIPVPSLERQLKIVAVYKNALLADKNKRMEAVRLLSGIDDHLLAELGITLPPEPENTLASRIFTAQRRELVGWRFDPLFHSFKLWHAIEKATVPNKKLGLCCHTLKSGFAAGGDMQLFDDAGVIQLRPTNIDANREWTFEKNIYLSDALLADRPDDIVQTGEVLFNNTNSQELVGKSVYMGIEGQPFFCSNHMTRIRTIDTELNTEYLTAVLNAYQRLKVFFSLCTNWNNQSGVNVELLRQLPIPVPPMPVQLAIAHHIAETRQEAKRLRQQAETELDQAKRQIETLLLGAQP